MAHISAQDFRDFLQLVAAESDVGKRGLRAAGDLYRTRLGLVVAISAVAVSIAWTIYSRGLSYVLDHPSILNLIFLALLCAPLAFVWLWFSGRLGRQLKAEAKGDALDESTLRNGLNLGEAKFHLENDAVHVTYSLVRDSYLWCAFRSLKETSRIFCLMIDKGVGVIVPKHAFDDEATLQSFRNFAETRIGQANDF